MPKPKKASTTQADKYIEQVLAELSITDAEPATIYGHITQIVKRLKAINKKTIKTTRKPIAVGTTGTITERLCEYGLKAAVLKCYRKLGKDWKWIGDFYVQGCPLNTIVTVKSFKAKERLLSSGTGNLLSPTIGYGLFDAPKEWNVKRLTSYLFRAFLVIYVPEELLNELSAESRAVKNINGRPFLRGLPEFVTDLQNALNGDVIDPRKL